MNPRFTCSKVHVGEPEEGLGDELHLVALPPV